MYNQAEIVFKVFMEAVFKNGLFSRVQGNHRKENVLVAAYMLQACGCNRELYIFGKSVHNEQIQWLWVDNCSVFAQT